MSSAAWPSIAVYKADFENALNALTAGVRCDLERAYGAAVTPAEPACPGIAAMVHGADVLMLPDGKVYASPLGRTALPFIDELASGGITETFAALFDHCVLCGRQLTAKGSLENMVGPVCSGRLETVNAELLTLLNAKRQAASDRALNEDGGAVVKHAFVDPTPADMASVIITPERKAMLDVLERSDPDGLAAGLSDMMEDGDTEGEARAKMMAALLAQQMNWAPGAESQERALRALYELCLWLDDPLHIPAAPSDMLRALQLLTPAHHEDVAGPYGWLMGRLDALRILHGPGAP